MPPDTEMIPTYDYSLKGYQGVAEVKNLDGETYRKILQPLVYFWHQATAETNAARWLANPDNRKRLWALAHLREEDQ